MSNALLLWSLTSLLLPQVVRAGPHSTVSLSPYLANVIPTCAHSCVESYIVENFHSTACRDQQDLKCLCTSKTTSGLTLGEGALQCTASRCANSVLKHTVEVYDVCADVANARPMTHGTLTATQVYATTVAHETHTRTTLPHNIGLPHATTTSLPFTNSAHHSTSLPTAIITATKSKTSKSPRGSSKSSASFTSVSPIASKSTHTSSIPSSSTTFIASPATSSAAPKPQPVLTKSQIAGVSVAGVASAALAFGVLFCLFCVRRKDRKRRSSGSSFGGDKVLPSRPSSPRLSSSMVRDLEHGDESLTDSAARQRNGAIPTNSVARWSFWRKSTKPEEIGIALGPESATPPPVRHEAAHDEGPVSAASYRTTSQLLPDKPRYSLFPPPLRIGNPTISPVSPQSPDSAETRFTDVAGSRPLSKPAPRGRNAYDTSQPSLQQGSKAVRPSISDPFLDAHDDFQSPTQSELRSGIGAGPSSRPLQPVRKPVPAHSPPRGQRLPPTTVRSKPSLQISNTYPSRPTYEIAEDNHLPDQSWGLAAKRRNSFARPPTNYSNASDTSFEDAGDGEGMPIVHPVLSPVAESPKARRLPRGMRPPQIPSTFNTTRRPSPESPTRRPPQKSPYRGNASGAPRGKYVPIPQPEVAELYGSPVSPKAPWSGQPRSKESLRRDSDGTTHSAKWQILVKPGLDGIDGANSPRENQTSSLRSGKTGESRVSDQSERWAPVLTPTRRGADLRLDVR